MFTRVLSRLSLSLAERAILRYISKNPGKQLFQINAATLNSHHSWGTKSVLSDLERHGKIYVRRFRPVRVETSQSRRSSRCIARMLPWLKKQLVPSMQGIMDRIAEAKAIGFSATSAEGLSPLERGFYLRKLELEAIPCLR